MPFHPSSYGFLQLPVIRAPKSVGSVRATMAVPAIVADAAHSDDDDHPFRRA
jgi:hypothetical protein